MHACMNIKKQRLWGYIPENKIITAEEHCTFYEMTCERDVNKPAKLAVICVQCKSHTFVTTVYIGTRKLFILYVSIVYTSVFRQLSYSYILKEIVLTYLCGPFHN